MQKNETSMSVAELQKMIHVWKSRRITDSTVSKLLELYLGLTGYMDNRKVYPQENFYEIRNSLRFATTQALVEAVKMSGSFPFVTDPATGAVKAFRSPLYGADDSEIPTEGASGLSAQTFVATDNNINNIYTLSEERTSNRSSSPKDNTEIPSEENSSQKERSLTSPKEAAVHFFHLINEDPAQKARILNPLISYFQQQEKIDRAEACRVLVCLVNEQLIPYFAAHPQFPKNSHEGRLSWLSRLLKSAYGGRLLNEAARSVRLKCEQEAKENTRQRISELRTFHPVSPHEWTDRASGLRFYDDADEGTILIPAEAPPRPAATAQWNVLSKDWSLLIDH